MSMIAMLGYGVSLVVALILLAIMKRKSRFWFYGCLLSIASVALVSTHFYLYGLYDLPEAAHKGWTWICAILAALVPALILLIAHHDQQRYVAAEAKGDTKLALNLYHSTAQKSGAIMLSYFFTCAFVLIGLTRYREANYLPDEIPTSYLHQFLHLVLQG